ncbi:MAG: hypothetical protein AABX01_03135 [Candidatus Micrarchaeota archaeon]
MAKTKSLTTITNYAYTATTPWGLSEVRLMQSAVNADSRTDAAFEYRK